MKHAKKQIMNFLKSEKFKKDWNDALNIVMFAIMIAGCILSAVDKNYVEIIFWIILMLFAGRMFYLEDLVHTQHNIIKDQDQIIRVLQGK